MEKPLYPSKTMRITQGYNTGSHLNSYAIDKAGENTKISNLTSPFTGTIKKIYTSDANEVWLESNDKVEYPDGTIDYMTILFAHDNDVSNLFVGKVITKGEVFYQEGTKGNATGNHVHIECARGKYISPGWYKTPSNNWSIINSKRPEDCLWIDDTINLINTNNYNFKKIVKEISTIPVEKPKEEIEVIGEKKPKVLIFTCQKDDIYALKLFNKEKLYIEYPE